MTQDEICVHQRQDNWCQYEIVEQIYQVMDHQQQQLGYPGVNIWQVSELDRRRKKDRSAPHNCIRGTFYETLGLLQQRLAEPTVSKSVMTIAAALPSVPVVEGSSLHQASTGSGRIGFGSSPGRVGSGPGSGQCRVGSCSGRYVMGSGQGLARASVGPGHVRAVA